MDDTVAAQPCWPSASIAGEGEPDGAGAGDVAARLACCTEATDADVAAACLDEALAALDQHADPRVLQAAAHHVPRLLAHFRWHVRARAYRVLRRAGHPRALAYCGAFLEVCVARALAVDSGAHGEREQGLKFVRWTMRFGADAWVLGPAVVKALMAVAEHADDAMRGVCVETLCELLVRAPERLWYAGGLRTLTLAALDGPWAVAVAVAAALAHVFDSPATRRFVHPGVTLGAVASALAEPAGADHVLAERAKAAALMLAQLLKSWGGIQYFLADGRRVISALATALSMAGANAKAILGMLLELFGLSDDFDLIQFELQPPRFDVDLLAPFHLPPHAITLAAARSRLLPVDYVRTLLLMTFVDEGLVEALVAAALETRQPEVVDASAALLKWLPQHPHMPLPESYAARFHSWLRTGGLSSVGAADEHRALAAKRLISRIERIPSLSVARLPSQQTDTWAASLSSSVAYRRFLRQRRLRQEIAAQHGHPALDSADAGSTASTAPVSAAGSAASGPRGLAAGLKDNAVRVLRSSASTGNLKTGTAGGFGALPLTQLSTVDEDSSSLTRSPDHATASQSTVADFVGSRGRRSLDIMRSPQPHHHHHHHHHNHHYPQQQQQQPATPHNMRVGVGGGGTAAALSHALYSNMSALSSPFAPTEGSMLTKLSTPGAAAATAGSSHADLTAASPAVALHPPFMSSSNSTSSAAIGSASLGPTPPLIARSRAKSRSRTRNSMVIVNNLGVEETPLATLIQESRVTSEDNPMHWNWETIRAIILGPISASSRRLPEEIKISGFLARLSYFFHPSSLEFCDKSRTTSNEEYLEIGRQLIRILISSADGLLLIDESRLLPGIVDEIKKQNNLARKKSRDESCFSFARLQMTMSPGYFHFLGEIDSSVGGDSLLERNRLYDAYYQVVELPDQVLLIQYILSSMSYATEGHARIILRKVASSPHETLRLLVPGFLLYLASDVPCRPGSVSAWAIEVLLAMVLDASPAVRSAAAQSLVLVIDLAAENPYLDQSESATRFALLLDLRPMLDLAVITDIRPLILRIIADERGFAFLHEQGIVDSEMEAWGALEGIFYVQSIELDISRALAFGPLFSSTPDGAMMMTTSSQTPVTPPHLFGELAKSSGGRAFLREIGIPRLLFETLANIPWNSTLPADVTGLKATLWAIGAMGASRDGYLMLEPLDAIAKLMEVARSAESLSIKGTCLYALALLSRSPFAAEAFKEKGWLLCSSCYGAYEYAVPRRLESILDVGGWASGGLLEGTYVFSEGPGREPDIVDDEMDSVQKEIINSVVMMGNHVLVNSASKTLMRLRTSHPHYFRLLPLYLRVMHLLGKYRYRLSTRRFIYDVFDVNLGPLHQDLLEQEAQHCSPHSSDGGYSMLQGADESYYASGGGHAGSRRFSSSSQHFLHTASESQRKRASTLQEYSSSPVTAAASATLFPRRPTNGLLDDIRPAPTTRAGGGASAATSVRRMPT
ncbi:hypothetical protein GGI04_001613 [Coemansia thaxteri]|nr:hypothetical protein GGI04_001613 [Coemansia thaxteri]